MKGEFLPASDKQWDFPCSELGRTGERLLLAACLRIGIKFTFESHCYSFGGHCYIQNDGGPIGLRLTNAVARVRMLNWALEVLRVLENNKLKVLLCKSYVDDVRWLLAKIVMGYKYEPEVKQLIYDLGYEVKHTALSDYSYTSMVMLDIMNDVVGDMCFTIENQCEYENKRLPTLDFSLKYITKGVHKVQYLFFKKPMASKLAIIQTSALAENIKSNTITQETIRRLSNTGRDITQVLRNNILEVYVSDL